MEVEENDFKFVDEEENVEIDTKNKTHEVIKGVTKLDEFECNKDTNQNNKKKTIKDETNPDLESNQNNINLKSLEIVENLNIDKETLYSKPDDIFDCVEDINSKNLSDKDHNYKEEQTKLENPHHQVEEIKLEKESDSHNLKDDLNIIYEKQKQILSNDNQEVKNDIFEFHDVERKDVILFNDLNSEVKDRMNINDTDENDFEFNEVEEETSKTEEKEQNTLTRLDDIIEEKKEDIPQIDFEEKKEIPELPNLDALIDENKNQIEIKSSELNNINFNTIDDLAKLYLTQNFIKEENKSESSPEKNNTTEQEEIQVISDHVESKFNNQEVHITTIKEVNLNNQNISEDNGIMNIMEKDDNQIGPLEKDIDIKDNGVISQNYNDIEISGNEDDDFKEAEEQSETLEYHEEKIDNSEILIKESQENFTNNIIDNINEKHKENIHEKINDHSQDDFEFNEVVDEQYKENNIIEAIPITNNQTNPTKIIEEKESNINNDDDFEFNEVPEDEQEDNKVINNSKETDTKSHLEAENAEIKVETQNQVIGNYNIHDDDDFEFNEVTEDQDIKKESSIEKESDIKIETIQSKDYIENDDDFEFNEVTEEEDKTYVNQRSSIYTEKKEEIIQNPNLIQEKIIGQTNNKTEQNKAQEDDDDFFDFVEEEENASDNKPDINENNNNSQNVLQLQENLKSTIKKDANISKTNPSNTNISKINIQTKNVQLINKLLSNYEKNYLEPDNNFINEISKTQSPLNETISDNEFKNFYLDVDSNSISLKNIIENIPNKKLQSEIGLRTLTVEEINKLSSTSRDEKNTKINPEKEIKYKNSISEITNSTIKKLYFKYIDLKNIYVNSIQAQIQSNKTIPHKNIKTNKKEMTINDKKIENTENDKNTIEDNTTHAENKTENLNNLILDDNTFSVKLDNTNTNTMMHIGEKRKKDEDESSEEEEFEEVEEEKNKNAIFIDEELYSIVMDTNLSTKNDINTNANIKKIDTNNYKDSANHEQSKSNDEDKMIEYLKSMTMTNKAYENEKETEIYSVGEEEKNDEIFQKIIDNLPNYNFLISKYVEYPDSLFNI